ncbi:MAG: superoxide dismutase [Chlamydiae bacterium]|nr:superoxide dismutase [Chlamydiota bacterium]
MADVFTLPPLTYAYDALEPYIDAKTMEIHYTKHHAAYVAGLNKAVEEFKIHDTDLKTLLAHHFDKPSVRNNGGGHYNHTFFWKIIDPKGSKEPIGALAKAIESEFGSIEAFKEQFTKAALSRFGSGWAWLVKTAEGKLKIISTGNQDVPFLAATGGIDGSKPIIGIDVWEHAYYLKYQNKRVDYVNAFYQIINWTLANELYG